MTIPEAIVIMRNCVGEPADVQAAAMMRLADVWTEAEVVTKCESGHEIYGLSYCAFCHGTGLVSNGNAARAEFLRVLAECGKVGDKAVGYCPHSWTTTADSDESHDNIPDDLFEKAIGPAGTEYDPARKIAECYGKVIDERLALLDAYAAADQPTRERWARETRAMVPADDVDCGRCRGAGLVYVYTGHGDSKQDDCWDCNGTGRIPAHVEATR